MKFLNQFLKFAFGEFSEGKIFQVTGVRPWNDFDSGTHLGTVVETAIIQDNTPYRQKDGEAVTNLFEKISFKVSKDVTVQVGTYVVPANPVATVYGQYRNQLAVKCDDIQIATVNAAASANATGLQNGKTPITRKGV